MGRIKDETISGVKWGLIQRLTMQPVQFVFGVILARLISPSEMGILGLTAIFFSVASILKDAGFGSALVRKQDRTETDCSTVFWFNVIVSALLAIIIAMLAPWMADFFREPALVNITRVSALMLFLNSTAGVHYTLYSARRDFKTPAIIGMGTTLVAMPFTIWLAYTGWSYWAVIIQGIISGLLSLVIIWIISPWKPRFLFSLQSIKEFFSYGSKLAASGLVYTLYVESRSFVIGRFYSAEQLALFSKATRTCTMPISILMGLLSGVTFPILSTLQDNPERLYTAFRKYLRLVSLVCLWPMLLLAVNSENLIYCLYGETWLPVARYMQIICVGVVLDPIAYVAVQLFMVVGRTDLNLRREVWIRLFGMISMIIGACYSVMGICVAMVFASIFNCVISSFLTRLCIHMPLLSQAKDVCFYLVAAFVAVLPCCLINCLPMSPFIVLPISVLVSCIFFGGYMLVKRDQLAMEVWCEIRQRLVHLLGAFTVRRHI